ncbi:MAG: NAD(P) transhydrogenase subunit alpha [Rhodospirillaceae bacterium]
MNSAEIAKQSQELAASAAKLLEQTQKLALDTSGLMASQAASLTDGDPFLSLFTIFVLACFVGYYVVWSVTPALHSPLMGVTNAISSVIIVGGILAAGPKGMDFSSWMGFFAIMLASVNIFGGFIVTNRMLAMFKKKEKK